VTVDISIETVQSQAKCGNCKVAHYGTPSLMEEGVEEYIIEGASQLDKCDNQSAAAKVLSLQTP